MITYKRETLIDTLADQTEAILKKAIEWQLVNHSKFALRPSPAGWSANECLQHLTSYGRYYLPAIERALQKSIANDAPPEFTPGWLGNYFTRIMQPTTEGALAKKMKSPKDHSPAAIIESHLVISEFIDQQEKLLSLLSLARKANLNKREVGISLAPVIKLKSGDVFMFLIAHTVRHMQQAARALVAAGIREEGRIIN